MASQVTLKALGLNYSPNNLALPEGSLVVANDVIVRRDNVIESRRGFAEYSQTFGVTSDTSKQLISYKDRILNHYSNILQYDTGTVDSLGKAIMANFSGFYSEVQAGLRIKSIEANKNLYFTTDKGIKKISARTAADFTTASGYIKDAGGTKALDFEADLNITQGQIVGFLPSDAAVAYRTLWGYRDLNDNLILGSPSSSISVYNYLQNIIPLDLNAFLLMLDNVAQSNPTIPVSPTYASVLHNITTNGADTFSATDTFSSRFGVNITDDASLFASNLISAATYLDKFSLLADNNAINNIKPLRVGTFQNDAGTATIKFATTYTFTITSATVVAGDVYINNNQAFTMISSGTLTSVEMTGYGNPFASGTLTLISGTGPATLTFSAFSASSNNPSDVFSVGDYFEIQGAINAVNLYTFTTTGSNTIAVGDVYSNNNQSFIAVTALNAASGDIKMIGTGAPLAASTLTRQIGAGTASVSYSGTPTVASSNYSILNNTNIGTNPNEYWQISFIDDTNKLIKFNTPASFATINVGPPGALTQIFPFNYRYIISTGDNINSTPLDQLTVNTPPVHADLVIIQNTINRIVSRLLSEKSKFISTALIDDYVTNYSITTAANVDIAVTIPTTILNNTDYFLQVYRTRNFTCTDTDVLGVTVVPDDEMRLVYEAFPTAAEFSAGVMAFQDTYPEALRDNNQNLYTNPVTGEGIAQANDVPPVAKDINVFKNVVFYANTKTRHRLNPFQLLGTANINDGDTLTIAEANNSQTYLFEEGSAQTTQISFTGATIADLQNRYLNIYSANDVRKYYIWFRLDNTPITFTSVVPGVGITTFTTATNHNIPVSPSSKILLSGLVSANDINGAHTVTVTAPNQFTIPVNSGVVTSFAAANAIPYVDDAIGVKVDILTGDTLAVITNKFLHTLNSLALDFISTSSLTGVIDITNTENGVSTNASVGTISNLVMTFVITAGSGEDATSNPPKVLLVKTSNTVTAAQSIELTSRSLVRMINAQVLSAVNAYYVSSPTSLPGQINLESKTIANIPFYVQASSSGIGASFNPNIAPIEVDNNATITRISGTVVRFTTSSPHGLNDTDSIFISLAKVTATTPPPANFYLNGIFDVTNVTPTTFDITLVTSPFNTATYPIAYSRLADVSVSNNEIKPNRIYYSKLLQPESVPILNYFDVGSEDQEILRIFPLRDSLFVFKRDGLFRVSGETIPFVVSLFDSSCILLAPDTVSVANNIVYGWTNKGISNVTEAGVTEITRPIDTVILKLASNPYQNFTSATWGIGYDSDNSYTVYTCAEPDDTLPTIGFRFSNLTNTWTNIIRSQTCGVIKNDKIYTGSGSKNLIDVERKNFNRTDYSDRDFNLSLQDNFLNGQDLIVPSIVDIVPGDVIVQEQTVTVYLYNALLKKLDYDRNVGIYSFNLVAGPSTTVTVNTTIVNTSTPLAHGLSTGDWINIEGSDTAPNLIGTYQITVTSPTSFTIILPSPVVSGTTSPSANILTRNYFKTLEAVSGDNMRTKLLQLAQYLDTDSGLNASNYYSGIDDKTGLITIVAAGNPVVITSPSHGLVDNRIITISGSDPAVIPALAGTYTVTPINTNQFSVPVTVTTGSNPSSGLFFSTSGNSQGIEDLKACFNYIIDQLNDPFSGTLNKNYSPITQTTMFEAVILNTNRILSNITINIPLQIVKGIITVYKAIPCEIIYAPTTFGDPLTLKQVYESTLMMSSKAFTKMTAGFSSDLKPEFTYIDFYGQGNGIFGHYSNPGFGFGFFGGSSNSAPCRTIVPRQNQRCRFINMSFEHRVAREIWSLYGITLTFNQTGSTRAYR